MVYIGSSRMEMEFVSRRRRRLEMRNGEGELGMRLDRMTLGRRSGADLPGLDQTVQTVVEMKVCKTAKLEIRAQRLC